MKKTLLLFILLVTVLAAGAQEKKTIYVWKNGSRVVIQDVDSVTYAKTVTTMAKVPVPQAVDLGLSVKWASCNLGASRPEQAGNYYAWAETTPKQVYSLKTYKYAGGPNHDKFTKYCVDSKYGLNGFTDDKYVLDPEDDAATVNLGGTWRMPTYDEWNEFKEKTTCERIVLNGVMCIKCSGPNGNSIIIPFAGYREGISLVKKVIDSTDESDLRVNGQDTEAPYYVQIYSYTDDDEIKWAFFNGSRTLGFPIRPVCQ